MIHYHRDMWARRYHILDTLTEADSGPKYGKILWNYALEITFKELKCMVSAETMISYLDWNILFTFHTDASDRQLGAVISQNNKPIGFLSIILRNPQRKYNTTEKKLLTIVECLK